MTPSIEQLISDRDNLSTAINRIRNEHQAATNCLEELEASLPGLIASVVTGKADTAELEAMRHEILKLQMVTKEPYRTAIEIIEVSRKAVSEQIRTLMNDQDAVNREKTFRCFFNYCLETHTRKASDWERLKNDSSHWHKRDIDQLDRLHYEYENKKHLFIQDKPTFIEFAENTGFGPYNLDVTIDNITRPRK